MSSCRHRYVIRGDPFRGHRLECHLCGRFYGRIMDERDLTLYRQLAMRDGEIDLDAIDWGNMAKARKGKKVKPRSLWREADDGIATDNLS